MHIRLGFCIAFASITVYSITMTIDYIMHSMQEVLRRKKFRQGLWRLSPCPTLATPLQRGQIEVFDLKISGITVINVRQPLLVVNGIMWIIVSSLCKLYSRVAVLRRPHILIINLQAGIYSELLGKGR